MVDFQHPTWLFIVIIFGAPVCSAHLPFFGYHSKNRTDTKNMSVIPLNSPPKNTTSIRQIKLTKNNTNKPITQPAFLPAVTQSTVPIKVSKSNTSSTFIQSQFLPIVTQSTVIPTNVIKTNASNTLDQSQFLAVIQSTADPLEVTIFQKHEFEGEVPDDEYPDSNECVNATVSQGTGQEIDETRNCTSNTTITTTEMTQEIDESNIESDDSSETRKRNFQFSLGSFLPPISELPSIKLPALAKLPLEFLGLKKRTVTLTNFIVKPSTVYQTQYASCLQLENVKSVCNGKLITIEPTNTIPSHNTMYKRDYNVEGRMNYELRESSIIQEDKLHYSPPFSQIYEKLAPSAKAYSFVDSVLEPSELDYEFEDFSPKITSKVTSKPTPNLKSANVLPNNWINADKNGIMGLKIERIDKILFSVTTVTNFNYDLTATVIAENCLPLNLNIPFCSPIFIHQTVDNEPSEIIHY